RTIPTTRWRSRMPRRAEHSAGERARVLAMVEDRLAPDDDVLDALRALNAARRTARTIVRDLVLRDVDAAEIEDPEVGGHAFPHEAPIAEAHDARRLEGEATDRVLEREELPLAHPLAEHVA